MSTNRLDDYLDHMQQAASDACSFMNGLAKDDFLSDKRTQQAVIMSLIVIGEAATKIMENYVEFTHTHPGVPWRSMRGMRNRIAHGYTSTLIWMWYGIPSKQLCRNYSTIWNLYALITQPE